MGGGEAGGGRKEGEWSVGGHTPRRAGIKGYAEL